jgi:hypothetical protein
MFEVLLHEFFRCLCCDTNSFLVCGWSQTYLVSWVYMYILITCASVLLCMTWALHMVFVPTMYCNLHIWMPPLNGRWISIYRRDVLSLSVVGVKPFGKAAILAWVSITVPLMQGIICSSDLNRCLLLHCTVGILCMSALCFSVCVGSGTIHIPLSTIHLLMRCFWSVL